MRNTRVRAFRRLARPRLRMTLVMSALVVIAAACGGEGVPKASEPAAVAAPEAAAFPYTVVDSGGNEVVFDEAPARIVAYDGAAVETLFAIGEGDRVVATHSFVSYPPETASIPKVGDAFNMNVEKVVEVRPDLVFVFTETFLPSLEQAGLKILYVKSLSDNFQKSADLVRMWGHITGATERAEQVAGDFEDRVAAVERALDGTSAALTVFQDTGDLWTPGPNTLMGEVFELLKLQNIAHDVAGYAQMSPEVIVERDPDIILTSDAASFLSDAAFGGVSAVKEGRLVTLQSDALSLAGPRFVEGIEELARAVYPEVFE